MIARLGQQQRQAREDGNRSRTSSAIYDVDLKRGELDATRQQPAGGWSSIGGFSTGGGGAAARGRSPSLGPMPSVFLSHQSRPEPEVRRQPGEVFRHTASPMKVQPYAPPGGFYAERKQTLSYVPPPSQAGGQGQGGGNGSYVPPPPLQSHSYIPAPSQSLSYVPPPAPGTSSAPLGKLLPPVLTGSLLQAPGAISARTSLGASGAPPAVIHHTMP